MVNQKFLADTQTSKTIWDLLLPITAPQATGEGKGYAESDVGGARTDARSLQSGYTTSLTLPSFTYVSLMYKHVHADLTLYFSHLDTTFILDTDGRTARW